MHKQLDKAEKTGLGFGIIGSSADVALYSAMDTMERVKNLKSAMRTSGMLVDKKVKELLISLKQIIEQ